MTSSIMSSQKNYTITVLYKHFTTGNQLVYSQEMTSQLAARASHKFNRNNYYIWPYLDARWFFLYGGSSTTTGEVKIIFYPRFLQITTKPTLLCFLMICLLKYSSVIFFLIILCWWYFNPENCAENCAVLLSCFWSEKFTVLLDW